MTCMMFSISSNWCVNIEPLTSPPSSLPSIFFTHPYSRDHQSHWLWVYMHSVKRLYQMTPQLFNIYYIQLTQLLRMVHHTESWYILSILTYNKLQLLNEHVFPSLICAIDILHWIAKWKMCLSHPSPSGSMIFGSIIGYYLWFAPRKRSISHWSLCLI